MHGRKINAQEYLFKIGALDIKHTAVVDEKPNKVVQADFWIIFSQFNGHLSQQLPYLTQLQINVDAENKIMQN